MMSSALGMCPTSRYEFTVETMMSLSPFGHKGRLYDSGKPRELAHIRDAPVGDRFRLRVASGQRRRLVAVLGARGDPSDNLHALGLARFGRREEEKDILGALDVLVGVPANFFVPAVHLASHHRSLARPASRLWKKCSASSRETCPERREGRLPQQAPNRGDSSGSTLRGQV